MKKDHKMNIRRALFRVHNIKYGATVKHDYNK